MKFRNKGIDAVNISNFPHRKEVKDQILSYFKNQSIHTVSYKYTNTIARKSSTTNKHRRTKTLKHNSINLLNLLVLIVFSYSIPHVITGDLNINDHENLRNIISRVSKFREPQPVDWNFQISKTIMDSFEDIAREWIKKKQY